jgi:hypothetical protein
MKKYARVEVHIHVFLVSVLDEWSASHPGRFTPVGPGRHRIRGWVGPTVCLDAVDDRKTLTMSVIEPQLSSQ